ncbi:MAG: hypothetical protein Q8910_16895, partial [Bacteroidota bacterium]|nr:hypothetical protein [Bacteroidota bacterium]
ASLSCRHKKFTKKTVTASFANGRTRTPTGGSASLRQYAVNKDFVLTLRGGKSWNFLMNHRHVLAPW